MENVLQPCYGLAEAVVLVTALPKIRLWSFSLIEINSGPAKSCP